MSNVCQHKHCRDKGVNCIYLLSTVSPSPYALAARQQSATLRQQLSVYTSIQGITQCSMKIQVVKIRGHKREPIEITDYCRNKHACPTCMRFAYGKFRASLETTLDSWMNEGGSVFTQTLTLPNRHKPLTFKHEDLAKTWQGLGKSKRFRRLREQYGVSQYLRVLEDSLKVIGSNPHFHLTWFFDSNQDNAHMQAFCDEVADLWQEQSEAAGIRGTQATQQWSGPIRESNKAYARYMAKHGFLDLSFDASKPIAPNVGLKPLDFLRVMLAQADGEMYRVWQEYEESTYRKHRIQASQNFQWAP